MQQQATGKPEEELMDAMERLKTAERERDRARDELKEMKEIANEANARLTEAMNGGKVADVFTELNSVMESLSKSQEELRIKDSIMASLKVELSKAKELQSKLVQSNDSLLTLNEELSKVRSSEAKMMELLSESQRRLQELEMEIATKKEIETKMLDSFASQTHQLEEAKIFLEESKMQISSLQEKINKLEGSSPGTGEEHQVSLKEESERVKSELDKAGQSELKFKSLHEEVESLRNEANQATKAEENSKKAMDDLAIALKEVATELTQKKEKLMVTEKEVERYRKEEEELKEKIKEMEDKHDSLLSEARKEADIYRNTAERLRIEAEESLLAWNAKETGFVDCIKSAEDEKVAALEENRKLLNSLTEAENLNKTAKQENNKLRDILKQALNEASVAKEAAGIARAENSQLKDILAEKDDALIFITRENENLRINEANALETIKDLNRMLGEVTGKEFKSEEAKDQKDGKKLSNTCNLHLKELIIPKHEDHKLHDKHEDSEEDDDSANSNPLKGSILDQVESPVPASHHRRRSSSTFLEDVEVVNPEDDDHIHMDDLEGERNSRKKKALLRRFGDIIIRRRSTHTHKKEPSVGGESHKRETPKEATKETSAGGEGHNKKDPSHSGELHKKEQAAVE
ncbi:hypothetical protein K2173_005147 [Erythroxylum novogranatense]|uniref:Uncharacterized protein n=1 Tax=Erythroxylum novogranatense TaxID=1862640 RepID=A0AAV8TUF4_9ROSI|nr:hypothetical protein K2173_005147 [Erythroxylum novogranatense]